MDFGTAVVTLAVGAIAVLPRIPALTSTGRARAVIQRDCDLWAAMPPSAARDRLGRNIEGSTDALLRERARDKRVENGWLYSTGCLALAWAALVASTAITGTTEWAGYTRAALQFAGLATGAGGLIILLVTGAVGTWQTGTRIRAWLRERRAPAASTYDI